MTLLVHTTNEKRPLYKGRFSFTKFDFFSNFG
jgi:hypothetical protein